ncbi:hypothetical protein CPB84DRAFT_1851245 [Gymnopilus junonius]|uniref:Uncharacterized protein n=1 Tax=Gymnopilus junonius TaxID=109634 RepID=A0A9P5TIQ4_GYMJU|nr:hypothetical protein CPB84DRAFT_1851245 [Gymnopilus junonius]
MDAGSAQGITLGPHFTAHATNLADNPALAHIQVMLVDACTLTLKFVNCSGSPHLPLHFYLKPKECVAIKPISLYSHNHKGQKSVFPPWVQKKMSATLVNNVESCNLELSILDGQVYFEQCNNLLVPSIDSQICQSIDLDETSTVYAVGRHTRLSKSAEECTIDFGKFTTVPVPHVWPGLSYPAQPGLARCTRVMHLGFQRNPEEELAKVGIWDAMA